MVVMPEINIVRHIIIMELVLIVPMASVYIMVVAMDKLILLEDMYMELMLEIFALLILLLFLMLILLFLLEKI